MLTLVCKVFKKKLQIHGHTFIPMVYMFVSTYVPLRNRLITYAVLPCQVEITLFTGPKTFACHSQITDL